MVSLEPDPFSPLFSWNPIVLLFSSWICPGSDLVDVVRGRVSISLPAVGARRPGAPLPDPTMSTSSFSLRSARFPLLLASPSVVTRELHFFFVLLF